MTTAPESSSKCRGEDIVTPLGSGLRRAVVGLSETIEASPSGQDPAADIRCDALVVQHPRGYLRKARVEMRE